MSRILYSGTKNASSWAFRAWLALKDGQHRVQLTYGSGDLVVMDGASATDTTPMSHRVMVRVSDVDAHYAHSKQSGARILREPETFPYGERQYSAIDVGGHAWTFSQSVADVDPSSGALHEQAAY